jgi:N,N'-diacetylbacillosaminyl-diphospho-undecaprenol alpha-1,3-N-acetylgalactosaminyltransferase
MKKILMICNTDGALYVFRKPIIERLIACKHEVVSISSESRYFEGLKELGVTPISLEFVRHSVSPFQNIRLIIELYRIIKQQRSDIVHNFTHKPAIYGTISAWLAGVKRICVTITGLGTLFVHNDVQTKLLRWLLLIQYKFALKFASVVFFQNPDDKEYFLSKNIVGADKAVLTNGSGIDLSDYYVPSVKEIKHFRTNLGNELEVDLTDRIVVLFPARAVPEKGFFEFYRAAKIISELESDKFLFLHLGLVDSDSATGITKETIEKYAIDSDVHWLGFKANIKEYMLASDVVVLPSYREGTPRSLIEALACGKVIITTDAPGCKETVINGWNGYLCKIGDTQSLIAKLMAVDVEFITKAKDRSRKYCEVKYNATWLTDLTFEKYFGNSKSEK